MGVGDWAGVAVVLGFGGWQVIDKILFVHQSSAALLIDDWLGRAPSFFLHISRSMRGANVEGRRPISRYVAVHQKDLFDGCPSDANLAAWCSPLACSR